MDMIGSLLNIIKGLFCIASNINCGKKVGILLPRGCGKTHLSQSLQSKEKSTILLDIESLVNMSLSDEQRNTLSNLQRSQEYQNIKLFLLPIWREFLKDLMGKFKHSSVMIFCSSPEALSHLDVSRKEVFIPSQSFFDEIISKISDPAKQKSMVNSRNEIISAYGSKAKIFSSYQDLERQISDDLQLTPKI